jgi:hypothetical protein
MKDDRNRDKVGSGPGDMSKSDTTREQGGDFNRDLDRDLDRNRNIGTGSKPTGQGSSRSTGDMGGSRDDKDNLE